MIDRDQVLHIARLAQLELDDAAVEAMTRDLSAILDYVDQLREVDVASVSDEPAGATPLRDDRIVCETDLEVVRQNAPSLSEGFYVVPPVFGGE